MTSVVASQKAAFLVNADGKELDLDIAVATMKVVVDFEGRKQ